MLRFSILITMNTFGRAFLNIFFLSSSCYHVYFFFYIVKHASLPHVILYVSASLYLCICLLPMYLSILSMPFCLNVPLYVYIYIFSRHKTIMHNSSRHVDKVHWAIWLFNVKYCLLLNSSWQTYIFVCACVHVSLFS